MSTLSILKCDGGCGRQLEKEDGWSPADWGSFHVSLTHYDLCPECSKRMLSIVGIAVGPRADEPRLSRLHREE